MNIILTCFFAAHWAFWFGFMTSRASNIRNEAYVAWMLVGGMFHGVMIAAIWGLFK